MSDVRQGATIRAVDEVEPLDRDVPHIDTNMVFRELILDEIRSGRLSRSRRRRIVRYAAALGLSAVDAGNMIAECREQLLDEEDPVSQGHALRLVEPDPTLIPAGLKLALAAALAIVLDILLFNLFW